MPKVYFRNADGKAFTKEIASEINYEETLEIIKGRFGIQKNLINLKYNEEIRTGNFRLNPEIPHHIVHIIDKSSLRNKENKIGTKTSSNQNVQDNQIEDGESPNIVLKDSYADPSDVPTCATLLSDTVNPIVMNLQMLPKYYSLFSQITSLKNAGFFGHLQQRYEGSRVNIIYSEYSPYRFPSSPQNQPQEEEDKQCQQNQQ